MTAVGVTSSSPAPGAQTRAGGATPAPRRFGALRYRAFALLWVGLLLSNSGTWMQNTAQGYLVYELTSSPLALGLLSFSVALPMLLLPPLGGVIADRVNRLALIRVTNTLWIGMTLVLVGLTWTGRIEYWQILAFSFLSAVLLAVDNPTRQALVPDLVPRSELMSAISLNSVAYTGASLLGPAIAGQLLAAFTGSAGAASRTAGRAGAAAANGAGVHEALYHGAALVFSLNALSYLAVLIPVLLWIRVPPRGREGPPTSIGTDLLEGLRYVGSRRPLVLLLLLTAVTSVFGRSFAYLMPVFARDVLGVGPDGLGLMYSAPGAGTLVGGLALAALGNVPRRRLVTGATVVFTLAVLGFAASRSYPLSIGLLFVSGVAGTAAGASIATLLQAQSPGRLCGRVMSLQTLAIIGMGPLGGLLSGALAQVVPAPVAVGACASAILIFVGAVVATQPAWQHIEGEMAT